MPVRLSLCHDHDMINPPAPDDLNQKSYPDAEALLLAAMISHTYRYRGTGQCGPRARA